MPHEMPNPNTPKPGTPEKGIPFALDLSEPTEGRKDIYCVSHPGGKPFPTIFNVPQLTAQEIYRRYNGYQALEDERDWYRQRLKDMAESGYPDPGLKIYAQNTLDMWAKENPSLNAGNPGKKGS